MTLSTAGPAFARIAALLRKLVRVAPQSLLLEGGRDEERLDAALYWAACCNCAAEEFPCLACPACRRILARESLDLHLFDGRISNREDQDNPGVVRAFTVENTRLLRHRLHEPSHGARNRVVIIAGMEHNREEAANAMLKLLEDPLSGVLFTLLTPQREQLLPTLVSRSFCLTLPWNTSPQPCGPSESSTSENAVWEKKLTLFLREGAGFLEDAAAHGAMDVNLARHLLLACQRAVALVMPMTRRSSAGPPDDAPATEGQIPDGLPRVFARASIGCLAQTSTWIFEAQKALQQNVTPARVMEALAAKLFVLLKDSRGIFTL
jgi:DNA polymerase-3 subunit delta'